jgi:O-antigen/teichoic acid export membrane protein
LTDAPDSVSRNAGFAFASRIFSAACTAAVTIVIVRILGPADFGTYALASGIAGLVLLPSDLGVSPATARFVAEARGNPRRIARVVSDAIRAKIIASGLSSLLLLALAVPIANAYGAPALVWPLRVLAIALLGESFFLLYGAIFQAIGRQSAYLRISIVESASEAMLTIPIVLLGGGAVGAIAGRAAAYAIVAVFGAILVRQAIKHPISLRGSVEESHLRRIFGYGSVLLIIEGAYTIFARLDAILIGAIISVTAVGQFGAALQITALLGIGGQAIGSAVAPRIAKTADAPGEVKTLERSLPIIILLQGLVLAPLVVWADPIARLILGEGFGEAAECLRAFAPYAFLVGISPLISGSVNFIGEARKRIPIVLAAVAINAGIDVFLLARIGVVGAAIGTDVAYLVYVLAHLRILHRATGLRLSPLLLPLAKALAAAAVMTASLFALGTDEVPLPILLAGALAGPAIYLVTLVAVKGVSPTQVRQAAGGIRAVLGQVRG